MKGLVSDLKKTRKRGRGGGRELIDLLIESNQMQLPYTNLQYPDSE